MNCLTWTKHKQTITAATWWPWIAPIACNYFVVRNLGPAPVLIRTDPSDANTEDEIAPNAQDGVIAAPVVSFPGGDKRCPTGTVLAYLKLPDGSPDQSVICTYVN